ncbi:MAG: hypothetical protein B7X11_05105 [Acidobacteria bacterium 37-65-4]|nr:MAG: hypothetical protein B7X11_05105 [Acidobacteria bacterium 37-65-4]
MKRHPAHPALAAAACLLLAGLLLACKATPTSWDSSPIDTSADPEQTPVEHPIGMAMRRDGYDVVLTPRADYVLRGVVLDRSSYYSGWNAALAPCDVAMAWGKLLEDGLYRKISWSQSGRWYWWTYGPGTGLDNAFIARYSSNTHVIPADTNLERAVKHLGKGDVAELSGELVDVGVRRGGYSGWWHTSLSRSDTGDGSCEVLYLRRLKEAGRVYE